MNTEFYFIAYNENSTFYKIALPEIKKSFALLNENKVEKLILKRQVRPLDVVEDGVGVRVYRINSEGNKEIIPDYVVDTAELESAIKLEPALVDAIFRQVNCFIADKWPKLKIGLIRDDGEELYMVVR